MRYGGLHGDSLVAADSMLGYVQLVVTTKGRRFDVLNSHGPGKRSAPSVVPQMGVLT